MPTHDDKLDDLSLRLARMEESYRHLADMLERHATEEDEWRDTLSEALNGNGHPGIKTRLDRIERVAEGVSKHFWAVWSAVLAVGAPAVFDLFRKHPN